MKAMLCTRYGPPDVLELGEVEKPAPKADQVLIRICATTVSAADCEIRRFDFPGWVWLPMRLWFGIRRPRRPVLGQDLAGVVEATGSAVRSFKPGDRVFATTGVGLGAHAEFICLREETDDGALASLPGNLSFEEAAAVPYGGLESLQFLRKANIQPGQRVLINGAGGSFGTFAVQLAKHFGADVTAVDLSLKHAMLRTLGADHVLDHTRDDYTLEAEVYDVVFDVVGKGPFSASVRSLRAKGRYLLSNAGMLQLVRGMWISLTSDKKVIFGAPSGKSRDLVFLRELIEAGKVRPVIDRRFPLEQMVEAHRYVETGQKLGNVVITVGPGS